VTVLVTATLSSVTSTSGAADDATVPAPKGDLYRPPRPLRDAPPGTLIWAQKVAKPRLTPPATIWRVLYHSRTRDGADVAVSGIALVPDAAPPAGTRPVYAWGHGTSGMGDQCAPSKRIRDNLPPYGGQQLERGAVVVATDYDGLGTPGVPTYLDGVAEGQAMLDSVRAVAGLPNVGTLGDVVIAGHSQGGRAALFASQLAVRYAPELHVSGVLAIAPGAELSTLVPAIERSSYRGFVLIAAIGWQAAYGLDPVPYLTAAAVKDLPRVAKECADATIQRYETRTRDQVVSQALIDAPAVRELIDENSPGGLDPHVPILVVQGDRDEQVPPIVSAQLAAKYCALGATVSRQLYVDASHDGVIDAAGDDALAWIAARFNEEPAAADCA
jgi:alpha-beta hydrolase superfamily lysophospholipase